MDIVIQYFKISKLLNAQYKKTKCHGYNNQLFEIYCKLQHTHYIFL
jgi:hypothetical protein